MSLDHLVADAIAAAKSAATALAPAAMGAFVSQAFQRGLAWGERAIQFVAGIIVSRYTTIGISAVFEMFGWSPLSDGALQAIGFVFGMIAAQAAPKFIAAASDAIGTLPTDLKAWLLGWLPGKRGSGE